MTPSSSRVHELFVLLTSVKGKQHNVSPRHSTEPTPDGTHWLISKNAQCWAQHPKAPITCQWHVRRMTPLCFPLWECEHAFRTGPRRNLVDGVKTPSNSTPSSAAKELRARVLAHVSVETSGTPSWALLENSSKGACKRTRRGFQTTQKWRRNGNVHQNRDANACSATKAFLSTSL